MLPFSTGGYETSVKHACYAWSTMLALHGPVPSSSGKVAGVRAQPEMSRNVQKYSKDVYLRASEAQQCRVHSTIVLPLFTTAERNASLGVVEVVQTRQDMSFAEIVSALARSLEVREALKKSTPNYKKNIKIRRQDMSFAGTVSALACSLDVCGVLSLPLQHQSLLQDRSQQHLRALFPAFDSNLPFVVTRCAQMRF